MKPRPTAPTQLQCSVKLPMTSREYEFAGLEWWNGTVEWSTGLDYWSATPTISILNSIVLSKLSWLCPIWSHHLNSKRVWSWHNARINVMPHYPPLGHHRGQGGGLTNINSSTSHRWSQPLLSNPYSTPIQGGECAEGIWRIQNTCLSNAPVWGLGSTSAPLCWPLLCPGGG